MRSSSPLSLRMVVSGQSMRFLLGAGVAIRRFSHGFTPVLAARPTISSKTGFSFTPGLKHRLPCQGFVASPRIAYSSLNALDGTVKSDRFPAIPDT